MVDQDISSLVVVDDGGVLLGIVTRVDLMRALSRRRKLGRCHRGQRHVGGRGRRQP
ncbi:MAG: CBS domain-containing protein [Caldilineaceae bacterium]